jgi:hypothetical protein
MEVFLSGVFRRTSPTFIDMDRMEAGDFSM